ncbi:unnamed protein product, partial [Protopolystoma xenopodis]
MNLVLSPLLFILLTALFPNFSFSFKLSDSKLLFPYYTYSPVNYTISGSDGTCYEWSSGTPEIVTVSPVVTGHVVKCDVIVDNIHRIEIGTTTQELYLHNTPEALVVVGYDEFGNTFSSLDGIPFEWKIHGIGPSDSGHSVLRFLTWTESEYTTPSRIGKLESEGMQVNNTELAKLTTNDGCILTALRIGQTTVTLLDINVEDALYHVRENLGKGKASLTGVVDEGLLSYSRRPTSLVYIVEPAYLTFTVKSITDVTDNYCRRAHRILVGHDRSSSQIEGAVPKSQKWVLEVGQVYKIRLDVFDQNSHRIFPSDNQRINFNFSVDAFELLGKTLNGSIHLIRPLYAGVFKFTAQLMGILDVDSGALRPFSMPLLGTQELTVHDSIRIFPSHVLLPWQPRRALQTSSLDEVSYGYPLTAVGGSGDYVWSDLTPLPLESADLKGPFLDHHSNTADDFITSS